MILIEKRNVHASLWPIFKKIKGEFMSVSNLVLRCYSLYDKEQWIAFCLDFDLAAQADSFEEAKEKLEDMIKVYVFDALVGEDKEYSEQMLFRKAPLIEWIKYYYYLFIHHYLHLKAANKRNIHISSMIL